MRTVYQLSLIVASILLAAVLGAAPALAQPPVILTFPDTPCDSTSCTALVLNNTTDQDQPVSLYKFRDGVAYTIDSTAGSVSVIPANTQRDVTICFTPGRRGVITDSLLVVRVTASGSDSLRVRLSGRGIGPDLMATPIVLNFPKTNPAATSTLKMTIVNNGERTFQLTTAQLAIPAPFRLLTVLPLDILPGDSIEIDVIFEPLANGIYSLPVVLFAGCNVRLQLGLNGSTDLIGTGAILRVSKTGFNPVNNEQVPCDVSRCTPLTISNVGNATLIVDSMAWALGTNGYIIQNPPAVPFLIAPNSQRDLTVCLQSTQRGVLRDTLVLRSNNRNSIAFGMIIDVSRSMEINKLICGTFRPTRMEQARSQANNFLSKTLLYLPTVGVQDQITINRFSDTVHTIFPLKFVDDIVRADAQDSVTNRTEVEGPTFTGKAIRSMIDTLSKSPISERVIILITDGQTDRLDSIQNPVNTLVNLANARNIRIFCIGIDLGTNASAISYLNRLANGTRGTAYISNDCSALQGAFEAITDSVSKGSIAREPFAIKVLAPALISSGSIRYDSTYIHDTRCDSLTLTNVGEGDAIVNAIDFSDMVGGVTGEFFLTSATTLPLVIPEGGQVRVPVCFTPSALRLRSGLTTFSYNNCGGIPRIDSLFGTGYAVANLRITDTTVGLPGTIITLPVYVDSLLAGYEVNSISFTLRWNKTMLDLRSVTPGPDAGGAAVSITTPIAYGEREATVGLTLAGTDITGPGRMVMLEFQVLRGDTLASTIELVDGVFQDNNPKRLLANAGFVAFDSTCFRDSKPIIKRSLAKVVAGEISPNLTNGRTATLGLTSTEPTTVRVELYTTDGILAAQPTAYDLGVGANEILINVNGFPAGHYYAVLYTEGGQILSRQLILVH